MSISLELTKENIVDQTLFEMKLLKKAEKNPSLYSYFDKIYKMDHERIGNKKFVARQPEITEEVRHKIKGLLREFLKLKISEENLEIDSNSNKETRGDVFRFKIKLDNSNSSNWYELSEEMLGRFFILSFEKNNQREYRALSNDENILFQRGILARVFDGDHLENISFRTPKKKPDYFWSGWKTSLGDFNKTIAYLPAFLQTYLYRMGEFFFPISYPWRQYQQVIRPAIAEVSLEFLRNCPEACPNVVEICGGEGDLAVKIAKSSPKQLNYYLLECNDYSLQQVKRHVLNEMGNERSKIIPIKTDITNLSDYFMDVEKKNPMRDNSIDLIVGSGALTAYVLENKEVALEAAKKCYELLKPGGKLVLAGHADSLLNNEDFTRLGFKVINSFLAGVQDEYFSTKINQWGCTFGAFNKEFYVLEK